MRFLDDIFEMGGGYVLDFSNRTFDEFFAHEIGVDIYDPVYSLNGTSKAKRLRTFLQTGQKTVVIKTLRALWDYRETIQRRMGEQEKFPGARNEMSAIIERLGGEPLPDSQRSCSAQRPAPDPKRAAQLAQSFEHLSNLDPQPRGYAFERFLKDLFDAYKLEAREAFRLIGEQIDGSFQLGHETYLLEAKWQNTQVDAGALRGFHGKVEDKSAWARGLFVSYAGYTEQGLAAFGGKRIVLMDGLDLHETLRRGLSVDDVIASKVRRAAETGRIFVRVRDLIPE
jgi:hypothetical protein